MEVTSTFAETRGLYGGTVGLLPTLGFFHEGHLRLMGLLRERCDTLVVSLFVNPTQFNDPGDFDAYPRDIERDSELAGGAGVDILFAPSVEEVYGGVSITTVEVTGVTDEMEGRHRPGHFVGVATVVAKLFAGLRPEMAMFGRKDAQQLVVLRAMTSDLRFPIEIVEAPVVREPDGLALSSRNVRLGSTGREKALAISRGLFQASEQVDAGEGRGERLEATVGRSIRSLQVDYVKLASLKTMKPIADLSEPAVLAVAASVDGIRLIDNVMFDWIEGRPRPDRGVFLDELSTLTSLP
ncbi:MAG: pantoate--beta-alanine ligase [Actinobacteria bacterium]|nr:pantoate--beta-alanine ligase [Actinomycetota bacterium]MCI0543467.1 pantoate--beta-alanine ligase [Actinomycetota bacterium]MCI0677580.1 pantoate--beta-alanine ligase [Actinomycetota bacterium]